jgi:hypothetical protein
MILKESKSFIEDPKPGMSIEEKNRYLSAQLAQDPSAKMTIVRIDRMETVATGWWVTFTAKAAMHQERR